MGIAVFTVGYPATKDLLKIYTQARDAGQPVVFMGIALNNDPVYEILRTDTVVPASIASPEGKLALDEKLLDISGVVIFTPEITQAPPGELALLALYMHNQANIAIYLVSSRENTSLPHLFYRSHAVYKNSLKAALESINHDEKARKALP